MNYDFLKDLLPKSKMATNLKNELDLIKKYDYSILKSGTNNLDLLLGGGFRSKKSYVIYGANSTGKTQLCHQLCVEAFKIGIKTIYIDTESTFRPERIKELCSYRGLNEDEVLKTILVASITSNDTLQYKINEIDSILHKSDVKLIIIDTINNYYRLEQGISYEKSKNQFIKILRKLNSLTEKYDLISIFTSQVSSSFDRDSNIKHIPVGVQYLNHFFSEFIYLLKINDKNLMHLINSSYLKENKLLYNIAPEGIIDGH